MGDRKLSAPIFLTLSGLGNYRAESVWECFEYLDLHWPAARTADYRRAKAVCRAAIDGVVSAESARRALIVLARRNGLLATGPARITGQRPTPFRRAPKRAKAGPLSPGAATVLAAGGPEIPPAIGTTLQ